MSVRREIHIHVCIVMHYSRRYQYIAVGMSTGTTELFVWHRHDEARKRWRIFNISRTVEQWNLSCLDEAVLHFAICGLIWLSSYGDRMYQGHKRGRLNVAVCGSSRFLTVSSFLLTAVSQ